ncbi:hypothetical protein [Haloarcula amylovorans]|uniref:hypothetical protein n=1 Tax=Haloarcula amylovorans TaxID=2562280 RepID=UPI00107604A3|nr:hypothetical protein [Halomicroarcula amylolytica]
MWSKYDFEEIEELHREAAEDYTNRSHANRDEARTLLTATQNLHDFRTFLEKTHGPAVDDEHEMQLFYLRRGIRALFSIYWMCKNHSYSACYGRIRFLFDLYLVVRELNREKEKTKRKYQEFKQDMEENDYGPYDTLPMTDYIGGKRRQLKGDLAEEEDMYGGMYDRLSNLGSHPHTLKSAWNDGEWNEEMEEDVLRFGVIFAYAIAAQYIRTFEDSRIDRFVREEMDGVIVQVLLVFGHLPVFLEEDLEFGSQIG